jgi:RNA polymerase sigma factor (sigma-70 family)
MTTSDLDLLREYAGSNSQDAFAELVKRHLNLVYSAALRQVRSPQLAEEVAQSTFADLARHASRLAPDTILTAWLYQVSRRTAIDVVRREARRQLREQIATEMNAMNATASDWTHIEPLLDEAMHALDETDRAAVLLRYFENKSMREVGVTLGTSDDAAQKRVSRAVERLREFFAKRGVTVGASGLVVVISANAVQAAPAGLAGAISAAAALGGTAMTTTATATATKAIVMTTLQKTAITAALAAVVGAGIYEAHQASTLQNEVQTFRQQQASIAEQIRQMQYERDDATNRLAALLAENEQLKSNKDTAELLKLRGEVTRLRQAGAAPSPTEVDSRESFMKSWLEREDKLKEMVRQNPGRAIPELQLLSEQQWLNAAMNAKFDTDKDVRHSLADLRHTAENNFAAMLQPALSKYMDANNKQFPTDLSQLQPYFSSPVADTILSRWQIVPQSDIDNVRVGGDWVVTEKAPVDPEFDQRWAIGQGGYGSSNYQPPEISAAIATVDPAMKAYAAANNGKEPADPSQILPYLTTPEQQAAYQTLMKHINQKASSQ